MIRNFPVTELRGYLISGGIGAYASSSDNLFVGSVL